MKCPLPHFLLAKIECAGLRLHVYIAFNVISFQVQYVVTCSCTSFSRHDVREMKRNVQVGLMSEVTINVTEHCAKTSLYSENQLVKVRFEGQTTCIIVILMLFYCCPLCVK